MLFAHPPVIDFNDPLPDAGPLRVLKTNSRKVVTLEIGEFIARETIWSDPATGQLYPSASLRGLVAPGCNYGYDVLVQVGRALFLDAQPVRQIIAQLAAAHVHLSASAVAELGRRFIILLALAHRQCAGQLKEAMTLQGGYILHLDATYEDKSPLLMTGIDAVMEIVLGNVKLPSEKAAGIVPFLRQLNTSFGPPLALVHDMSKGILSAIQEVFPGVPDFICHFHFLRDLGKDLLGDDYDIVRKRLQVHGAGALRARLRVWQKKIDADPPLLQALQELPTGGLPTQPLQQAPLLAAYLLAHWVLAGSQEGQGYGFPFDRPLRALARRALEVCEHLENLKTLRLSDSWRDNLPFHHLSLDLRKLADDRALEHALDRLETDCPIFDQMRQALQIAPITPASQGLNHDGEKVEMNKLQLQVNAFLAQIRARPDFPATPRYQKMIEQIVRYDSKLFAAPLVVSTPQGPRSIQPQRTNNLMERFFRDFKRDCRRKTGAQALGRTLRTMLADTPLVKNLKNPAYLKILLNGQPTLEVLFAQIDPATVRKELKIASQNPEKVPRALKQFIAKLNSPDPIHNFIKSLKSNRIS